jgi:hypothetical protein
MQTQGGLGAFDGGLDRFFAIVGFFFEKECAHRADVSLSKVPVSHEDRRNTSR